LGVMPLRGQYWSIIMTAGSDALQYASAELQADVEVVRAAQAQVLTSLGEKDAEWKAGWPEWRGRLAGSRELNSFGQAAADIGVIEI